MTTYMRDNSGHSRASDFTALEEKLAALSSSAPGVLFRSRTVIMVQWYWLILPLIVLLLICAYLTAAIVQGGVKDLNGNTQAHLWKSSAVVPLVIGHRSRLPGSADALYGHDAMQALKRKRMQLMGSKDGWAFVGTERHDIG